MVAGFCILYAIFLHFICKATGIVESGTSFDNFTQENVTLIFSHINSVKRKQFNGKSAYDMFTFAYSKELAELLGISFIEPKNVIQTSKLLKHFS